MGGLLEEASGDLGATGRQTFRHVTLPGVQTLPLWIFGNLFGPNRAPVVAGSRL